MTTEAEDAVGHIHDRMPLLVERERWADWLDPDDDATPTTLTGLLVPAAPGRLEAYPVSTRGQQRRATTAPSWSRRCPLEAVLEPRRPGDADRRARPQRRAPRTRGDAPA